jgi:hypothetical protein
MVSKMIPCYCPKQVRQQLEDACLYSLSAVWLADLDRQQRQGQESSFQLALSSNEVFQAGRVIRESSIVTMTCWQYPGAQDRLFESKELSYPCLRNQGTIA